MSLVSPRLPPAFAPVPALPSARGPGAAVLAQVGDILAWPLLVLQGDGRLLHANRAARRLLRCGQTLVLQPNRELLLVQTALQPAFDQALAAASRQGLPALLHWPAAPGTTRAGHAVTLTPLARPAAERVDDDPALAPVPAPVPVVMPVVMPVLMPVLMALATTDGCGTEIEAYARQQGLSAGETRVLRCLASGCSSVQIAARLGTTPSTVRSQLLNLRRKTGHSSVTALLLALARLPPAAVPSSEAVGLFEGD